MFKHCFPGEGLSGLIPAVIAIGQGVGDIVCNGTVAISTEPNFSVRVYFIILSGILLVSALAFLLLNFWDYCKSEMVVQAANAEVTICQPTSMYGTLDSVSESSDDKGCVGPYTAKDDAEQAHFAKLPQASTPRTEVISSIEVLLTEPSDTSQNSGVYQALRGLVQVIDIPMWKFFLLLALIILINMTLTTFLSSIQIYSVLPYGLEYYHLATTLPQIANPVACLVALFVMAEHTAIIVVITFLGQVCVGYLIYAAAMSPTPPLHGETGGGVLAVSIAAVVNTV